MWFRFLDWFFGSGIFKGKRKNELHSKCAIQECQDTCLNPTNSLGCTGKCKHGCICAEGFIRNSVGECVLPLNCGKIKHYIINFYNTCIPLKKSYYKF